MRREMNFPERILWERLRQRFPGRPVFRRQHPFPPYVLDFYCATAWLVVEIDGWPHTLPENIERDAKRDAWLRAKGVEVLRFTSREVVDFPDVVSEKCWRAALERGLRLREL
jgi:very-short-patch-repair endonuclease